MVYYLYYLLNSDRQSTTKRDNHDKDVLGVVYYYSVLLLLLLSLLSCGAWSFGAVALERTMISNVHFSVRPALHSCTISFMFAKALANRIGICIERDFARYSTDPTPGGAWKTPSMMINDDDVSDDGDRARNIHAARNVSNENSVSAKCVDRDCLPGK